MHHRSFNQGWSAFASRSAAPSRARQSPRLPVASYLAVGRNEGAELIYGGRRPAGLERGNFIEPTIFAQVGNEMRIAQKEIFGPVVSVIPFADKDEVIRLANANDYGLAVSVWTRDIGRELAMHGLELYTEVKNVYVDLNA